MGEHAVGALAMDCGAQFAGGEFGAQVGENDGVEAGIPEPEVRILAGGGDDE
ncbi:MAG: hypothetical protein RI897_2155 [Verrucomicrobiota bacterium]